jgi:hypothetical protein
MPKLLNTDDMAAAKTVSAFAFSGKRPEELDDSEYTIADIEFDVSYSMSGFEDDVKKALAEIVDSCSKNPRSENMLVRAQSFSTTLSEVHGFKPLADIDKDGYNTSVVGGTALYDAILAGAESIDSYGAQLTQMDFMVNGIQFIVTDGEDNSSRTSLARVASRLVEIRRTEKLESLKIVLIGIGDNSVKGYLQSIVDELKLDQFLWAGDITASKIAKIAQFISESISSSSEALGTGAPSQNIESATF